MSILPLTVLTDLNIKKKKYTGTIVINNNTDTTFDNYALSIYPPDATTIVKKCAHYDIDMSTENITLTPNSNRTSVIKPRTKMSIDIKGEGTAPNSVNFIDKTVPSVTPTQPIPVPEKPVTEPIISTDDPLSVLSFDKNISLKQVKTIVQLTSIFENSSVELDYGYAENIKDKRGITMGCAIVAACSGTGDGSILFGVYDELTNGKDPQIKKYLNAMKKIDDQHKDLNPSLVGLDGLIDFVHSRAKDPLFIKAQFITGDRLYVKPSQDKARELGLKTALSCGQMFDAYLNHGEDGALEIVKKAGSVGADELTWLSKFLDARLKILAADKTWQSSTDRCKVYQKLLNNPNLKVPINVSCYGDIYTLI